MQTAGEIELAEGVRLAAKKLHDLTDEDAQSTLRDYKGTYPRCLCRADGAPLYIGQRAGRYFLARMPGTGRQHASWCPHFEIEREGQGKDVYRKGVIAPVADGSVIVRTGLSFRVRSISEESVGFAEGAEIECDQGRKPALINPWVDEAERTTATPSSPAARRSSKKKGQLSLKALFDLMIETARFNHWTPKMRGRRHYRQFYKFLCKAARDIRLDKKTSLMQRLLIPEPWDPDDAEGLEYRRRRALDGLSMHRGRRAAFLLVGLVRRIEDTPAGVCIRLRHLSDDYGIHMDAAQAQRLFKPVEFALSEDEGRAEVAVTLLVAREAPRDLQVRKAGVSALTGHYIPVDTTEQRELIDALVDADRSFVRPLRYDDSMSEESVVLTDCGEEPEPLCIGRSEGRWAWNGSGDLPVLPPRAE